MFSRVFKVLVMFSHLALIASLSSCETKLEVITSAPSKPAVASSVSGVVVSTKDSKITLTWDPRTLKAGSKILVSATEGCTTPLFSVTDLSSGSYTQDLVSGDYYVCVEVDGVIASDASKKFSNDAPSAGTVTVFTPSLSNPVAQIFSAPGVITELSFTNTKSKGDVTSCTVSPALPSGLTIAVNTSVSPATCKISGTVTLIQASTLYTVTASGGDGTSDTATVWIEVNGGVPALSFSGATGTTGTGGVAMTVTPTTLTTNAAALSNCRIKPSTTALPAGLTVNAATCVISGTPTVAIAATTFTLIASNSAGDSAEATVSLTINAGVPTLTYPAVTGSMGEALSISPTSLSANGGTGLGTCRISGAPALPGGLSINAGTCVISGTPSATAAQNDYTVLVTNSVGDSAPATLTLTIGGGRPTFTFAGATGTLGNVGAAMSVSPTTISNNGGGAISNCRIRIPTTALPAGLSVNTTTCEISGTPTQAVTQVTYTLIATNSQGDSLTDATVELTIVASADNVYTASTSRQGGANVTIVSTGDAGNNVWFAPSGTTVFAAGATMTTAGGTSTSIAAPANAGAYKLFVVNSVGNISTESTATLTVDNTAPTNQDTVFAASTSKQSGAAVTIVSSGAASNNVWFAPSGTTTFTAGATMTTAAGTATSIAAPATAGAFNLFVLDAAGNYSAASTAILTVDNTAPTNQNTVFAANATTRGGATVTIVSSGDATNRVWFAPASTTTFAASATMTTAVGNLTSISAPATEGTYYLYVLDEAGNPSAASSASLFVDTTAPTNQDTVFASSTSVAAGSTVTIVSSGNAANNVWFAPSGTTSFAAGATMTTAGGTATSIPAPATAGSYKLFVLDEVGNYSTASTATLTVTVSTNGFTNLPSGPAGAPNGSANNADAYGAGTPSDPYRIYTPAQLAHFGNTLCATSCANKSFLLMNDINMNGVSYKPAYLDNGNVYFDGNHYKISNLTIDTPQAGKTDIGFIGSGGYYFTLANVTFENLVLENPSTTGTPATGVMAQNFASGNGNAYIYNVHVTGNSIIRGSDTVADRVGGILGYGINTQIRSCSVDVALIARITATAIGGLAGTGQTLNIQSSFSKGSISNPFNVGNTGGLIGSTNFVNLSNSSTQMLITVNDHASHNLGGAVGSSVSGGAANFTNLVIAAEFLNASSPGNALTVTKRGGIVGIGDNQLNATTPYFDRDLAGTTNAIGADSSAPGNPGSFSSGSATAATTAEMKTKSFLSTLKFKSRGDTDVDWYMNDGNDIPRLVKLPNGCAQAKLYGEVYTRYDDIGTGDAIMMLYSLNPYLICTPAQLNSIGVSSGGCGNHGTDGTGACGKQFVLGADLDMTLDTANSNVDNMIGTAATAFSGTFDGRLHTIDGFKVTGSSQYVGLFRRLQTGTGGTPAFLVKNLGMTNVNLTGSSYVGAIAGQWLSVASYPVYMTKLFSSGTIVATSTANNLGYVGGLFGQLGEFISNDFNRIFSCYSTADITMDNAGYIGTSHIGGLFGRTFDMYIMDSYYNGDILLKTNNGSPTFTSYVGGIGGEPNYTYIYRSYSKGSIAAESNGKATVVGGVIGNSGLSYLYDVYSQMTITLDNTSNTVGGLIGDGGNHDVNKGYAVTPLPGTALSGAVAGGSTSTDNFTNVFWDADAMVKTPALNDRYDAPGQDGINSIFATSTANMQLQVTFDPAGNNAGDWDFTNTWKISAGEYPKLKWEP